MANRWKALACAVAVAGLLVATPAHAMATGEDPVGIESPTSPGMLPGGHVGPEYRTFIQASTYSKANLGTVPSGANWNECTPEPGHSPIVLIPGTGEDAFATWSFYAPQLANRDYCVFTFNYNPMLDLATGKTKDAYPFSGDILASAQALGRFVDRVLAETGASKVTLIGHSQGGGPLPRAYMSWYGGAQKVDHLIGLVPSNHGTTAYGINKLYQSVSDDARSSINQLAGSMNVASWAQQLESSSLNADLKAVGDTLPGIAYTVITTKWDQVVLPYTNAYLEGATNIRVQDDCPLDSYTHLNFTYDAVAFQHVLNALDPSNAKPIKCLWIPPRVV